MVVYLIFFALAYILVWILLTIAFLVVKGVVLIMAILFSGKRRGADEPGIRRAVLHIYTVVAEIPAPYRSKFS